jgi:site-specific recombinase XerD
MGRNPRWKVNLDWEHDKRLRHWLGNRKQNTVDAYQKAMTKYAVFTGLTPEGMIQEKWADSKKPPFEQGVVEDRLRAFNKWLVEEYEKPDGTKGMSPRSALTYCGAIADFYRRHNLPLSIKLTQEFSGATRGVNETEKMSADQIQKLAYYAPTLRDKAIIWCMFQSGTDVSTVLSLNWGHVEKELENPPMGAVMLRDLRRKKEPEKKFTTLVYKTALRHLKLYLEERLGKDYAKKVKYTDPLFVGQKGARHGAQYVQQVLRKIAPDSAIASEGKIATADLNPLRPHALRASFSDQMAKVGASKQLIDFMMGHKLQFDTAYFGGEEGLRQAYVGYAEKALEPKGLSSEVAGTIEEQKETIVRLENELTSVKKSIEPLSKALERLVEQIGEEEATKQLNDLFIWLGERQFEKQQKKEA